MTDFTRRVAARIAAAVAAFFASKGVDVDPGPLEDGLTIVFITIAIPVSMFLEGWIRKGTEWVKARI